MTQQEALDILKMGYSAYLTGEAGTGKTYVLNAFIDWLSQHSLEPGVTASTGIAATHLGGSTIHSWSGIGVRDRLTPFHLEQMEQKKSLWNRFENAHVLIVDEISMLSGEFLNMCDRVLRHMKRTEAPFGGIQVVFSGDFFQLPPVARDGVKFSYAFECAAWKSLKPVTCYLTEQHRHADTAFASLLSAIRHRSVTKEVRAKLAERRHIHLPQGREMTRLFTHNADVDALNEQRLDQLEGGSRVFAMKAKGRKAHVEALMRGCLAPEKLSLKTRAEVMFVKNDLNGQYVNGTQGTVLGFENDTPVVRTRSGRKIRALPASWKREEDGKVFAEITQIPLRLAWAITVHKSQGMTLDEAEMDLGRSFVPGQGYVALSRVRSLEGLYLRGLNEIALEVDEHVTAADQGFQDHSDRAVQRIHQLAPEEIMRRQNAFIVSRGGSLEPSGKRQKKKAERVSTREQTRVLLEKGFTILEAAQKRKLTPGTIVEHAEVLLQGGAALDFSYLTPSKEIRAILKEAVAERGFEFLRPVKQHLAKQGHNVSYDELRAMRLYLWSQKHI